MITGGAEEAEEAEAAVRFSVLFCESSDTVSRASCVFSLHPTACARCQNFLIPMAYLQV